MLGVLYLACFMNVEEALSIYQVVVLVRDVAMSIKTGNTVIPGLFCNNEINVFILLYQASTKFGVAALQTK